MVMSTEQTMYVGDLLYGEPAPRIELKYLEAGCSAIGVTTVLAVGGLWGTAECMEPLLSESLALGLLVPSWWPRVGGSSESPPMEMFVQTD